MNSQTIEKQQTPEHSATKSGRTIKSYRITFYHISHHFVSASCEKVAWAVSASRTWHPRKNWLPCLKRNCVGFLGYKAFVLKKWREFRQLCQTRKVSKFTCFPNFPGKQQHFHANFGKLMCSFRGIKLFGDKINPKKVCEPFTSPRYTRNFGAKTHLTLPFFAPLHHITSREG